ncbi:hypothetical protein NESM_000821600 [Novymonas esmeraldas]|uniref:Uncharacterized protein n=1 Tax=Novymonas esmeraldas TaxID=1808958 RepID=A0AAW0EYH7_9TRYP
MCAAASSSVRQQRHVSLFFDCRVGEAVRGFDEVRLAVWSQLTRLLTLAGLRADGEHPAPSVAVYLVSHTHVELCAPAPVIGARGGQPSSAHAAEVYEGLRGLATARACCDRGELGGAVFGSRMAPVVPHMEQALRGSSQKIHLLLFWSAYVRYTEATQSLASLRLGAPAPQSVHCLLADSSAVRLTVGDLRHGARVYRCPCDVAQTRAAVHASVGVFLLPDMPPTHTLHLRLGSHTVPVTAALQHLSAVLRAAPTTPLARPPREASASPPLPAAATWPPAAPPCEAPTLQLSAVLDAAMVDEALLCGDTWVVALAPSVATSLCRDALSLVSLWRAAADVFRGDALVFSGGGTGVEACGHAALRHHSFIGYFHVDGTVRLRAIVPTELWCVPPLEVPAHDGLPEQTRWVQELRPLRHRLVAFCSSAAFSIEQLLEGGVCDSTSAP